MTCRETEAKKSGKGWTTAPNGLFGETWNYRVSSGKSCKITDLTATSPCEAIKRQTPKKVAQTRVPCKELPLLQHKKKLNKRWRLNHVPFAATNRPGELLISCSSEIFAAANWGTALLYLRFWELVWHVTWRSVNHTHNSTPIKFSKPSSSKFTADFLSVFKIFMIALSKSDLGLMRLPRKFMPCLLLSVCTTARSKKRDDFWFGGLSALFLI